MTSHHYHWTRLLTVVSDVLSCHVQLSPVAERLVCLVQYGILSVAMKTVPPGTDHTIPEATHLQELTITNLSPENVIYYVVDKTLNKSNMYDRYHPPTWLEPHRLWHIRSRRHCAAGPQHQTQVGLLSMIEGITDLLPGQGFREVDDGVMQLTATFTAAAAGAVIMNIDAASPSAEVTNVFFATVL